MPVLIVQSAGNNSVQLPLEDSTIRIGRSQDNEVCLSDDTAASRFHAEISPNAGAWHVNDLGSHNGTFLDDQPVHTRTRLAAGARIRVGRTTIVYAETTDAVAAIEAAAAADAAQKPSELPMELAALEGNSVVLSVADIVDATRTVSPLSVMPGSAVEDATAAQSRAFAALSRAADVMLAQRPLGEVLQMALDMMFQAVAPERGAILLLDGDPAQLVMRASRGMTAGQQVISQTIADLVVHKQQSVLTSNAQVDPRFMDAHSIGFQAVHSALAVPLWNNRKVIGLVYADTSNRPVSFSRAELEALTLLANLVAVKIDNVRLFERDQQMKQLERELQAAAKIQQRLLPARPPDIEGYEVFCFNQPCFAVGGDYYDFQVRSSGRVALALGDVSGKGMGAALLMATCQAAFRAHAGTEAKAEDVIGRLNNAIHANSDVDKFITFFYGELDPETGALDFINAGHNPPLMFRAADRKVLELIGGGTILGFRASTTYKRQQIDFGPGDLLVTFSDGVTESQNAASEEFGEERLTEAILPVLDQRVERIWQAIDVALKQFVGDTDPFDDLTLTLIKRHPARV
jgi:sigma-B regulation protein RsbU (phosphoserine phosphatase)